MLQVHEILTKKKSSIPILSKVMVKDNLAHSTDLDVAVITSCNQPNGIYNCIAGELFRTDDSIDDFPELFFVENAYNTNFNLSKQDFDKIVDISNYCSNDLLRLPLLCVYFDSANKTLVAANGHFLKTYPLDLIIDKDFMIHKDSIKDLNKIIKTLKLKDFELNCGLSSESIKFKINDIEIYIRLVKDKFPDWKSVIPKYNDFKIEFDRKELLDDIKFLEKFDKKGNVILNYSNETVSIKNENIVKTLKINMQKTTNNLFNGNINNIALLVPIKFDDSDNFDGYHVSDKTKLNLQYLKTIINSIKNEKINFYIQPNCYRILIIY